MPKPSRALVLKIPINFYSSSQILYSSSQTLFGNSFRDALRPALRSKAEGIPNQRLGTRYINIQQVKVFIEGLAILLDRLPESTLCVVQ